MKTESVIAYHFTNSTLRDGSPIPSHGEWLTHKGEIKPCVSGLHASEHPFDALQFAPGNLLHLVQIRGDIETHGNPVDKIVGRERRILKSMDTEKLLRDFARWNARRVLHLWPNPPDVVVKFLETGDESLRDAAQDAAWAAAQDAARTAARAAARTAARAAAWAAARTAAWAAAQDAAQDAAWAAAQDAAQDAAWAAAWNAFIAESRAEFKRLVDEAFSQIA